MTYSLSEFKKAFNHKDPDQQAEYEKDIKRHFENLLDHFEYTLKFVMANSDSKETVINLDEFLADWLDNSDNWHAGNMFKARMVFSPKFIEKLESDIAFNEHTLNSDVSFPIGGEKAKISTIINEIRNNDDDKHIMFTTYIDSDHTMLYLNWHNLKEDD